MKTLLNIVIAVFIMISAYGLGLNKAVPGKAQSLAILAQHGLVGQFAEGGLSYSGDDSAEALLALSVLTAEYDKVTIYFVKE